MARGFDFGTSILVVAEKTDDGKTTVRSERNCFMDVGLDFEDMISQSGYSYIVDEQDGEKKIFIVGKDAIKLANLMSQNEDDGTRKSGLRRPMKRMILNSKQDKKAMQMLKYISQSLLGKPRKQGEICVYGVPADPLDKSHNTTFHSSMCRSFVEELGYEAYPINEALAVIYATNPTVKSEDEEIPMTGIGISFGGGGTNATLAYRGKSTIQFSIPRGGDWIDDQAAGVTSLTTSEITIRKEKYSREEKLDLGSPQLGNEVLGALYIYYENLIRTVINQFKEEFITKGTQFTDPIQVIVSGGTSKPKGFDRLVQKVIAESNWPFDISKVKRAKDPLSATAVGALTAALSKEKKGK